ncbi:MAG TPA: TetR/AcrR family transcriptional regulator [candidate division Zixibacteria bacterium]|nr:TetR/AcrR family transcriptional regulator [candidate division Zixibacteria bacterium]HEQ99908.1 TetR/AcrR family transcriptional regulator [candidate division Zixibacteria bacterium]
MYQTFHSIQGIIVNKKLQIIAAAQPLFSQFGIKKTTTDDIAKRAHISKATIYRYYRNKQEIFDDVVVSEVDHLQSAITEAVNAETTAVFKLRAYLLSKMGKLRDLANLLQITREAWSDHWPYGTEVQDQILKQQKAIVADILEFGNRTGELRVKNVELTAHLMVVSLQSVEYRWIFDTLNIPLSVYVDHMLKLIVNGIKKR